MSKTITIDPVTRVEGHGKITMHLDEQGKIAQVLFCVKEFRGLEKFCEGTLAENLPSITARICGVCPTSHFLASTKAIEDCLGTQIPETATKLRELLLLGQVIESHMTSLVMFTLPDLIFGEGKPSQRNIAGLVQADQEAVAKGIALRGTGTAISRIVGRRFGQPIAARIGGMVLPLREEERKEMAHLIASAEPHLVWFAQRMRALIEQNAAVFEDLGNVQTAYLGLAQKDGLAFYDGAVQVVGADGRPLTTFNSNQYFDHVTEQVENWSYMKFPVLKSGERFRVGPLARVNIADKIPTPLASQELEWFRSRWQRPAHKSLYYHYARLIETIYAFERAKELLNDPSITQSDVFVQPEIKAGVGVGIVEAPRGTLVHRYELDQEGKSVKVDLLVATQHNNFGLNDALKETATRLITDGKPSENTLNKLEMIVRAYDPCLSCATHTLGDRDFKFELLDPHGALIEEWAR
jgi:NAD-reducing hydrogenase large subunit